MSYVLKPENKEMKKIYEESGLSYKQIAALTGISINTLLGWSCGRRTPKQYNLDFVRMKIAEYKSSTIAKRTERRIESNE